MEVTRIRELTPVMESSVSLPKECRNGSYPYKGIDTEPPYLEFLFPSGRNGSYPNKGIDTIISPVVMVTTGSVEMKNTRIRELT